MRNCATARSKHCAVPLFTGKETNLSPTLIVSKTDVAAAVYRAVLADLSLADIFGQMNLSWLPMIKSASMVVSAMEAFKPGSPEEG